MSLSIAQLEVYVNELYDQSMDSIRMKQDEQMIEWEKQQRRYSPQSTDPKYRSVSTSAQYSSSDRPEPRPPTSASNSKNVKMFQIK